MGQKDIQEKILEAYNDVFADIVNVLLLKENYIQPSDLEDGATESFYKATEGNSRNQSRDTLKFYKNGEIIIAAIGMENQSEETEDMPVRTMGYDYADYRKQLDAQIRPLHPAITIVLNFSDKKWTKAKSLKELFGEIPDVFEPFIQDYKIFVFDIAFLPEETRKQFTSDFKIIADFFSGKRAGHYEPSEDVIQHVEAVMDLLQVFTDDERYRTIKEQLLQNKKKYEGGISMCSVLDEFEAKGIAKGIEQGIEQGLEQGIEQGIEQGLERGKNEIIINMHQKGCSAEQIADLTGVPLNVVKSVIEKELQLV